MVQKNKLIEPIIDVLIQLMAQKPDDDVHEEYFMGDPDQFTPITIATQTLDLIALHIPAEKVIPYLLARVEPAIQGDDIYAQKAAYLALAVLAEGCAERIRKKYLRPFLECVCKAIQNPNPVVRNAAFFALGQFAEHLQVCIVQRFRKEYIMSSFDGSAGWHVNICKSKCQLQLAQLNRYSCPCTVPLTR